MKIDFAMIDDRVVPINDVDGPVGPHFDVDRPERAVARMQHGFDFFGREAAAVGFQFVADRAVGAKVVGQQAAAPPLGHMASGKKLGRRVLGLAGDQAGQNPSRADGRSKGGVLKDKVWARSAGAVGGQRLSPGVEREAPGVDHAAGENLQALGLRPKTPDAATVESSIAVRRLDEAVDVNRLGKVQLAPGGPAQAVNHVMHVGVAEARIDHPPLVRAIVAVMIGQKQQFRGAANISAALDRHDRMRHQQPFGEYGRLVGSAVMVRIFQNHDTVVRLATRLDVWIGRTGRNPRPAARVPVQIDRVGDHRVFGEQVDLEPVGHGKGLQFLRDVRRRNILRHFVIGVFARRPPSYAALDFITMWPRDARSGDQFFLRRDEPVKLLHFVGQVPHFVATEEKNVRLVQRP